MAASPLSSIRRKVSKKKIRFKADGYDLDLTYIGGSRIIAMGYPSVGIESFYRNRLVDVRRFLDQRHGRKYKVYNLCSERQYASKCFDGRVAWYPFDDHNCPPFDMLTDLMTDLEEWLSSDEENVAVVHCKAGKGRTGLVVSAHLLHVGHSTTSDESLKHFDAERTSNVKGVTIPSQRCWVAYYERYMMTKALGLSMEECQKPLRFVRMIISAGAPTFNSVSISYSGTKWTSTRRSKGWKVLDTSSPANSDAIQIAPREDILLAKDVYVVFEKIILSGIKKGKKKRICGFWFNTHFVDGDVLTLGGAELDGIVKNKRPSNFSVEMHFS